jgi:hypothetical protein
MTQRELIEELDAILEIAPSEIQVSQMLRYSGVDELRHTMRTVRERLEKLKTSLTNEPSRAETPKARKASHV